MTFETGSHCNEVGCSSCRLWALEKTKQKLPTAGDTYCSECGTREADVSAYVKSVRRKED